MDWVNNYHLFLFDFDGLLVNTEELHFAAFKELCLSRGFDLDWDLKRYFKAAHLDPEGLKRETYQMFPKLYIQEPVWEVFYAEKKRFYQKLIEKGNIKLLPGVAEILKYLDKAGIRRGVVTNSSKEQVDAIRKSLPLLNTIPHWITREYYQKPKPDPEPYKMAIKMLGKLGDKVIGFEDTMRGLQALLGAGVERPVLICSADHPQMKEGLPRGASYFNSFLEITDLN